MTSSQENKKNGDILQMVVTITNKIVEQQKAREIGNILCGIC